MSKTGLYLLHLEFTPPKGMTGAGSMKLALTVDAPTGTLHGQARGTILEGTQHPQTFMAKVSGAMHSTGFGDIVRVGSVSGEAGVSVTPPEIGTYLAPFVASFSLKEDWTGKGQFSVGSNTYESDVQVINNK